MTSSKVITSSHSPLKTVRVRALSRILNACSWKVVALLITLSWRQLRPRGGAPARVADHRREIPDDQHRLVPEILELPQLLQRHRKPEMDVRRRGSTPSFTLSGTRQPQLRTADSSRLMSLTVPRQSISSCSRGKNMRGIFFRTGRGNPQPSFPTDDTGAKSERGSGGTRPSLVFFSNSHT